MVRHVLSNPEAVIAELREQTKWLRFLALQQLRPVLEATLQTTTERRAYDASNGASTTREVAAAAEVSAATVSRWWSRWVAIGLGSVDERGRFTRLADLRAVGVDLEVAAGG